MNLTVSCALWKWRYVEAMVFIIEKITINSDNRIEKLKSSEPCREFGRFLQIALQLINFRNRKEQLSLIENGVLGKDELEIYFRTRSWYLI